MSSPIQGILNPSKSNSTIWFEVVKNIGRVRMLEIVLTSSTLDGTCTHDQFWICHNHVGSKYKEH